MSDLSVKVLAFAGARDALGESELILALEAPVTARTFLERLCTEHPRLAPYSGSIRLAVNGAYVGFGDAISPGDEVAIIPPVAGG